MTRSKRKVAGVVCPARQLALTNEELLNVVSGSALSFHEPSVEDARIGLAGPSGATLSRRTGEGLGVRVPLPCWFMAPIHVRKQAEASHEPDIHVPTPPSEGGEGALRWSAVPMHVRGPAAGRSGWLRPLLILLAILGLGLGPAGAQENLIISEFMADNGLTIKDENGAYSDWIEIHNPTTNTISVKGWFLTDTTTNLTKWRFPDRTLVPSSNLLVFASEKNVTNATGRLHTNFKLGKEGEYLALVDPNTNVVWEYAPQFPEQRTDISYGTDQLDSTQIGYFSVPTPEKPNASSGEGFAPEVRFSQASTTFRSPFELTLSLAAPDPNAVIRFTLNGALPTNGSPAYTNAILITNSVQVRSRAFRTGGMPSAPHSEFFFVLNTNVLGVTSDLPLILLHTMGGGAANASVDKFVAMAVFEPKLGVSSFLNPPDLVTRARFKIRGSSTEGSPKSNWAVELWDEFNRDRDFPLLGMPADADWVFYGPNAFEPVLIHNPFAHALSRQIGRYSPRTEWAEVYQNQVTITTNSTNHALLAIGAVNYNGIYAIEEKIKTGAGRVDIDSLGINDVALPEVTGGYLLKIDRLDPGDSGFPGAGQTICYVDPKEPEIKLAVRDPQEQYIRSYFTAFGTALNSASFTNPVTGYLPFVDAGSWIDHHLLNVLTFNVDAMRLSGYFYKPRGGPITMGPLWDFDRALASTDGRDIDPRVWQSKSGDLGTDFWNYPWWGRMYRDPDFFQRWIDRYQQLRTDSFSTASLGRLVDTLSNPIRAAQPREFAKWRVSPRPRSTQYAWMTSLDGTWQGELNALKAWLQERLDFMDGNFLAAPRLSHAGGPIQPGLLLSIAGPGGATLYYTLDGTDPRAPGGSISANARVYTAPVLIDRNARVMARSHNLAHRNLTGAGGNPPISSPWSGLAATTFVTTRVPLIITEIMYRPVPPPAGSAYSADDFEFIELKNIGSEPLALGGCRFTNGIDFRFTGSAAVTLAPGERIVVAANTAAFVARYGGAVRVAGEFAGQLDNSGERIYLEGPLGEPILDFTYSDDWYPITDGFGFSLVVVDEQAPPSAWNGRANWRPSRDRGGAPGSIDPPPTELPTVLVNEVLTNPSNSGRDRVELWNPGPGPADISHWLLTDNPDAPMKYQFPADTVIQPGAYLVIDESAFNPLGGPRAFGLSSRGEEVWLFSATATGELTGYMHGFDFGSAALDVSFGRHVNSMGTEQWPAQQTTTFGASNSRPAVGPVVISEIHYRPPDRKAFALIVDNTSDEFIELRNITDQAVPLFDPWFPTNRWQLTDAVEFEFPPGVELGARAAVLVVSFNPTNVTQAAAFRAANGVPETVLLYGPYLGRLDNASDRVDLRRPTPPAVEDGAVDGIVVDRVQYFDQAPWPVAADGLGLSLQRLVETDYGNEPTNWVTAAPSPGGSYSVGPLPFIVSSPTAQTVIGYTNLDLLVNATGQALRYQWLFEGNPILGATNATLTITNIQGNQAGQYVAAVYNAAGVTFSSPAALTVLVPATIVRQPVNLSVRRGTNTFLFLEAMGTGELHYQWYFGNTLLPGATDSALSFTNIQLDSAGLYYATVQDDLRTTTSRVATVQVQVPAFIAVQPGPGPAYRIMLEGQQLTLTSVVGPIHPTLPLTQRWRRNSLNIPNETNSTLSLTLTNMASSMVSSNMVFSFTLSNAFPPPVTSSNVTVQLQSDRDGDGIGDAWEGAYGLSRANPADALLDSDGDGMSNRDEFYAGTNPQNAQSRLSPTLLTSSTGTVIRFDASSNLTYSVLWRESMTRGHWATLTNLTWRRTNWTALVPDPLPRAARRVYRIVTPQTGETPAPGPTVLTSPEPVVVNTGEPAELNVEAMGAESLHFQWLFNGSQLPGETSPTLRFGEARTSNHGSYTVQISDAAGALQTDPASLTVQVPPVIEEQPQDTIVEPGHAASFSVKATGVDPLRYLWLHNGRPLRGATNSLLLMTNLQQEAAGSYSVLVWHTPPTGRAYRWSKNAQLKVLP